MYSGLSEKGSPFLIAMNKDKELLASFLAHAKDENLCINHIIVVREGEVSASFDRIRQSRFPVWSISKGFTSIAIGILRDEGLLSLDERVLDIFPESIPMMYSDNLDKVTVKHLLTMTTGIEDETFFDSDEKRNSNIDLLNCFFKSRFSTPGTKWSYSSLSTYILSRIVAKRSGMDLCDYLKPRLFDKIGIKNPLWASCQAGYSYGGFGLNLSIDELSRYSELLSKMGEYDGLRIVSREYMEESTKKIADDSPMAIDDKKNFWGYGYGYQFIMNPIEGFRSDGMYGQFAIALPKINASVSVMSLDDRTGRIGTLLYKDIVNNL